MGSLPNPSCRSSGRRFWTLLTAAILLFSTLGAPLDAAPLAGLPGGESTVTVDLRESDLVDILKYLAKKGDFNLFVSAAVQGKVSLYLRHVKIKDVLEVILQSHGLAHRQSGDILYVMTQEEYRARYGEEYTDVRQTRSLRLRYAEPVQVARMLETSKSALGSVLIDEKSGVVTLSDTPERLKAMTALIDRLDRPLATHVFDLGYARASDVEKVIRARIDTRSSVSLQSDARANQLVVTAPPARMREIARLVKSLDRRTREVAIDTQILQLALTDAYRQGIDWRYLFRSGELESLQLGVGLPLSLSSAGSIGYGTVSGKTFQILVQFLKTLGDSKVLASPRLTVIEGEEAKILIGTREAYVTSTTTTGGAGVASTAESVTFLDVGVQLRVTPLINRDGYVTMKIRPEVSRVDHLITTPSNNQIPIVDTTQAETRVMVKDGETLVIGGLRRDERTLRTSKIPYLGDVPVLGNLFRNHTRDVTHTELVVFLTPHVVHDERDLAHEPVRDLKGVQPYGGGPAGGGPGAPAPPGGLAFKGLRAATKG